MEKLDENLQDLMWQVRERTLQQMQTSFEVDQKTQFNDLVTTVDKDNERFIDQALKKIDPVAQIISEEGFGDQVDSLKGRVFIVDPIDGTLNFVKQKTNFAIMLACYEDGQPKLGYIMDVMNKRLYHGGPELGVWCNDVQLKKPQNLSLRDSLIDINHGI